MPESLQTRPWWILVQYTMPYSSALAHRIYALAACKRPSRTATAVPYALSDLKASDFFLFPGVRVPHLMRDLLAPRVLGGEAQSSLRAGEVNRGTPMIVRAHYTLLSTDRDSSCLRSSSGVRVALLWIGGARARSPETESVQSVHFMPRGSRCLILQRYAGASYIALTAASRATAPGMSSHDELTALPNVLSRWSSERDAERAPPVIVWVLLFSGMLGSPARCCQVWVSFRPPGFELHSDLRL